MLSRTDSSQCVSVTLAKSSQPSIGHFEELFERSLRLFEQKHPNDSFRGNATSGRTVHDLYKVVMEAKAKYESRNKEHKARRWLTRFSKRVLLYGNIIDTFAQHHPEYVALAWGTFKMLFVLVMNQEELVSELSKVMCKIAEVLPRMELKAVTYATDDMTRLIESLLSSIIELFHRVIDWYQENCVKHAFNSFWRPYRLRFQDICDEIDEGARKIDKLAEALMQAEIRELLTLTRSLHLEQTSMSKVLKELKQIVISNNAINAPLILNTHQNTCRIQIAQILSLVSLTSLPDPKDSLEYCISLRRRRSRFRNPYAQTSLPSFSEDQVALWLNSSESSLLHLRGGLKTRDVTKDLTAAIVELLSPNHPVIWVLKGKTPLSSEDNMLVQLLKHMTWQALRLHPSVVSMISADFNAAELHSASSEQDWFRILQVIIRHFKRIFVVLDLDFLYINPEAAANFSSAFYSTFLRFFESCKPTVVKVLFSSYRRNTGTLIAESSENEGMHITSILHNGSQRLGMRKKGPARGDLITVLKTNLESLS